MGVITDVDGGNSHEETGLPFGLTAFWTCWRIYSNWTRSWLEEVLINCIDATSVAGCLTRLVGEYMLGSKTRSQQVRNT